MPAGYGRHLQRPYKSADLSVDSCRSHDCAAGRIQFGNTDKSTRTVVGHLEVDEIYNPLNYFVKVSSYTIVFVSSRPVPASTRPTTHYSGTCVGIR
jgi:hypothetical protein